MGKKAEGHLDISQVLSALMCSSGLRIIGQFLEWTDLWLYYYNTNKSYISKASRESSPTQHCSGHDNLTQLMKVQLPVLVKFCQLSSHVSCDISSTNLLFNCSRMLTFNVYIKIDESEHHVYFLCLNCHHYV